jgi:hypothetical protein
MAPEARQKDPAPDFGKIAENIGSSQGAGRVPSDSPATGQGIKARLPILSSAQRWPWPLLGCPYGFPGKKHMPWCKKSVAKANLMV